MVHRIAVAPAFFAILVACRANCFASEERAIVVLVGSEGARILPSTLRADPTAWSAEDPQNLAERRGCGPLMLDQITNSEVYWNVGCFDGMTHWRAGATEYVARTAGAAAVPRLLRLLADPDRFAAAHSVLVAILVRGDGKGALDPTKVNISPCGWCWSRGAVHYSWFGLPLEHASGPALVRHRSHNIALSVPLQPIYDPAEQGALRRRWLRYIELLVSPRGRTRSGIARLSSVLYAPQDQFREFDRLISSDSAALLWGDLNEGLGNDDPPSDFSLRRLLDRHLLDRAVYTWLKTR